MNQKRASILVGKIFVSCGLIVFFILQLMRIPAGLAQARLSALNYLRPSSLDYLAEIKFSQQSFDPNRLRELLNYYQKVAEFIPHHSDALGLAGFCSFYLHQEAKAVEFYRRAIAEMPGFFWHYYNLGLIYLKQGEKIRAEEMFVKAANSRPEFVFSVIKSSPKIYIPNVSYMSSQAGRSVQMQWEQGYKNLQILQAFCRGKILMSPAQIEQLELEIY